GLGRRRAVSVGHADARIGWAFAVRRAGPADIRGVADGLCRRGAVRVHHARHASARGRANEDGTPVWMGAVHGARAGSASVRRRVAYGLRRAVAVDVVRALYALPR